MKFLKKIKAIAPLIGIIGIIGVAFFIHAASLPRQSVSTHTVSAITITHQLAAVPQAAKSKLVPPTPPPAPKTTTPTPTTHAAAATAVSSPTPAPVVVPSPASSVSDLVPVTPTVPASNPSAPAASTPTTSSYESANWSGYLMTSGLFTHIAGSWTVPQVSGNGTSTSADGTWIGIGGVSTSDLIQVGTQDIVSASGHVTTSAFYELLPSTSQTVPGVTVSAGDAITATLNEISSGQWTISIIDNTNGQSYTTTVAYTSSHSSAEWIEEDPSYSRGRLVPFDTFGTVSFTGSSTVENGSTYNLTTGNAQPITLVNSSGQVIATPSAVSNDGGSFSVNRSSN